MSRKHSVLYVSAQNSDDPDMVDVAPYLEFMTNRDAEEELPALLVSRYIHRATEMILEHPKLNTYRDFQQVIITLKRLGAMFDYTVVVAGDPYINDDCGDDELED